MKYLQYAKIVDSSLKVEQQLLNFNHFCNTSGLVSGGIIALLNRASIFVDSEAIDSVNIPATVGPKSLDALFVSSISAVDASLSSSVSGLSGLGDPFNSSMSVMSVISNSMLASGIASTGGSSKSGGGQFGGRFMEIAGLLYGVLSIPDSRLLVYMLHWISWALSIVNTLIKMVVKCITSAAKYFLKKVLAVIEAVLSSINFVLLLAIKIIEFNTDSFPRKNNVHQGFKLLSSACDLGAILGNNFGILAVGMFSLLSDFKNYRY